MTGAEDTIWALHRQGLSPREIATRTGRTRNAVLGHIWRYRKRGGPVIVRQPVTDEQMRTALAKHGGNLTRAAQEVGVDRKVFYKRGFRSSVPPKGNRSKNAETRALIDAIDASGLSDAFIADEVDMNKHTIRRWRNGTWGASSFLAQCVRTVLAQKNTPGY